MSDLPDPPVPDDVDLRTFPDMPVTVARLRYSDMQVEVTPEEGWYGFQLWCASWHQVPASSLPNDDTKLAFLAGLGRDLRTWKRVRDGALRGFELCSDGRLYHFVVAEKALAAWETKRNRTAGANETNKKRKIKQAAEKKAKQSRTPSEKEDGQRTHTDTVSDRSPTPPAARSNDATEQNRTDRSKNPPSPQGEEEHKAVDPVEIFETVFWKAYPSRSGANPKKPAREKFLAAVKRGVDPMAIVEGARAYAADPTTKHGTEFVAQAQVWLNQERWNDYKTGDEPAPRPDGTPAPTIPTVVPGWPAHLQVGMAKKYLMVWERDGESAVYLRPKPHGARAWPYKDPKTAEPFPRPGEPGCPVSAEAMACAVEELRRDGHDVTWTPASETKEAAE